MQLGVLVFQKPVKQFLLNYEGDLLLAHTKSYNKKWALNKNSKPIFLLIL